ncbi:MAG TPA: hypothetical protein VM619_04065 [Luteimonas sp.]|nr:hypothetical protein [Luteimonas sp.]
MTNPRDAPGGATEGCPEVAEALAQALAKMDRSARDRARRKPQTAEQRARYALRSRLKSCAQGIERLAAEVEGKHTDRSGGSRWGWIPPPDNDADLRGLSPDRPRLLDQWERIEREATAGCAESAQFVTEYRPMLQLALQLRHERPPERAADYKPAEAWTQDQRAWVIERMR